MWPNSRPVFLVMLFQQAAVAEPRSARREQDDRGQQQAADQAKDTMHISILASPRRFAWRGSLILALIGSAVANPQGRYYAVIDSMTRLLWLLAFAAALPAQHFEYDRRAPLDLQETARDRRGAAVVHDISYASPKGGRVPAYLVIPEGPGPFAAIIWGHWYWENSEFRNRREFLEEAVMLARAGVVSLLTDGPVARTGHHEDKTPLNQQQVGDLEQQVIDMRRGADLLLARGDVDPKRLAYVGHSYNATVGGILSGLDKRFRCFVLMAGGLSDAIDIQTSTYREYRQKVGPERFDAFFQRNAWSDPGRYVGHAAPAAVFLQYASKERYLTPELARKYAALVSEPKRFEMYGAPHALNAAARRDRIAFLTEQLKLKPLTPQQTAGIPDLIQPPEPAR